MSPYLTDRASTKNEGRGNVADCFRLGLNAAGWWVIRESAGRKAGLFRTRQAAIKYARDESPDGNFTIIHEPDGLELGGPEPRRAA